MKKISLVLLMASLMSVVIFSQETDTTKALADTVVPWKTGGLTTLTFAQTHFKDWAAGGEDNISINGRLNLYANYKKNKWAWDNALDLAFGQTRQDRAIDDWRKNDDMFDLNTKFGYKASKVWYVSGMFQFRTQLTDGKKYLGDTAVKRTSSILSPAQINFGVGMDYKPNDFLSVYLSPVNSKMTYVSETRFSPAYSVDTGAHVKYDLGFILKAKYQKEIVKNVDLLSKLDVFANYLEDEGWEVKKIDVNWEVLLSIKVWKALALNVNANLIYDDDIKQEKEGEEPKAYWQFKEVFGVGLTYKF